MCSTHLYIMNLISNYQERLFRNGSSEKNLLLITEVKVMIEIDEIFINPDAFYNANGLKLKGSELLHKLANGLRYEVIQEELEKREGVAHEE